jgi:hypothetical protein
MKRTDKKPAPRKAPQQNEQKRGEWVQYLPAIITATTAFVEVVLKHFHP